MKKSNEWSLVRIATAFDVLNREGGVVEIRIPKTHRGTVRGYSRKPGVLAALSQMWNGRASVYATINRLHDDVLVRAADHLEEFAKHTVSDDDVKLRQWLPLDVDSHRPRGIAATDDEVDAALAVRAEAIKYLLTEGGFSSPLCIQSGNGAWALWAIDLPNTSEITILIRRLLQGLHQRFSTAHASIDPAVYKASQLVKIPGTVSVKGDATDARPHRLVRLEPLPTHLCGDLELVSLDQLRSVVDQFDGDTGKFHSLPSKFNLVELFKGKDMYVKDLGNE